MIQIHKKRVVGDFSQSFSNVLAVELKSDFIPLLSSIKREYLNRLGLSPTSELLAVPKLHAEMAGGEIYISKSGSLFYYKISSDKSTLEAGSLLKSSDIAEFNTFLDSLKPLIQRELKVKEVIWESLTADNLSFVLQGARLNPNKEETSIARQLEDPELLNALIKNQSQQNLSGSVLNPEEIRVAEPLLQTLINLGLITKDFVVLCKERGQQIIKVNSREAIDETSQKGLKCFLCGKPISEESVEELLTPTELGKRMIEHGYWISVRLLDALTKVGIKESSILTEEDEDSFNLYFIASGEVVCVSVFNRKLSLSDAYTLSAKLSVNQAATGILVNSQKISPILREFLVSSNPQHSLHFVDSLSNLEEKLALILQARQEANIRGVIDPFSQLTSVSLQDMVCQKLFGENGEPQKSTTPAPIKRGKASKDDSSVREESTEEAKV